MRKGKAIHLILAALLATSLWGCGSNRDSDGAQEATLQQQFGTDEQGRVFVGGGTCVGCHQDISFSDALVQGHLQSEHVVHEDHITAQSPEECLVCHDPVGDGSTVAPFIDPADVPAEGLAAVTCENCHGAGGEHFGTGPIPNATPGVDACGACHRDLPQDQHDHVGDMTDNIISLFETSEALDTGHAASFSGKNFPGRIEGTSMMSAVCARCHTDEGFRELFAIDTGFAAMLEELDQVPAFDDINVSQCRTCHDPHFLDLRGERETQLDVNADPAVFEFETAYSAEFNLCTGCHQAFLTPDAGTAPGLFDPDTGTFTYQLDPTIYNSASPEVGAVVEVHNPATGALLNPAAPADRAITDTHFAAADDGSGNPVAGYNINAAAERPCTVCHDPHGSTKFLQDNAMRLASEWGASGHAAYSAEPFTHDFSDPEDTVCMKCHNGSEYTKFVKGIEQEDLDNSEGARVIACVACHDLQARSITDTFALGPLRPVDEVAFPSGAVQSIPDGSNLCMECHQGRAAGTTVEENIVAGDFGFVNRHYFAAAAIFFGGEVTAGVEYPGKTYMGRNTFPGHQGNDRQTCTECHMRGEGGEVIHTFGLDPKLLSFCAQCHTDAGTPGPAGGGTLTDFDNLGLPFGSANVDYDGDTIGESFQGEITGLADALLAQMQAYATANNLPAIGYLSSYPYWFVDTDGNGLIEGDEGVGFGPNANRYDSFDGPLLRAAFNFHAAQDPCSDIHNYKYVLQTLFDSVEDLGGAAAVAGFTRP